VQDLLLEGEWMLATLAPLFIFDFVHPIIFDDHLDAEI
jgi:hypothetical protein